MRFCIISVCITILFVLGNVASATENADPTGAGETKIVTTPKVEPATISGANNKLKLNYSGLDPNTTYTIKRAVIIGGTPGGWETVGTPGKPGALPIEDIGLEKEKQYAYAVFNDTGDTKIQSSWYSQIPNRQIATLGSEGHAIGSNTGPPVGTSPPASTTPNLVPCGKYATAPGRTAGGVAYKAGEVVPCEFNDFMKLIDNIINFILKFMAIPIAAIMFAYAGFLMVTSGGSTESRGKAKNIATNTVFGLVIVAGAWLIVKTLLSIMGYTDLGLFFKLT